MNATKNFWDEPEWRALMGGPVTATSTGPGPKGQPKQTINTPQGTKMIHANELKLQAPDGKTAIIPSEKLDPDILKQLEKQAKMGGFASGGLTTAVPTPTVPQPSATQQPVTPAPSSTPSAMPVIPGSSVPTPSTDPGASSDINTSLKVIREQAAGKPDAAAEQALNSAALAMKAGTAGTASQGAMNGQSPEAIASAAAAASRANTSTLAGMESSIAATEEQQKLTAATQLNQIATLAKQYGDQEAQRMSTDVQTGMTLQSFLQLHPNASAADYQAIKDTQNLPQLTTQYNAAVNQYNQYVAQGNTAQAAAALKVIQDPQFAALNKTFVPQDPALIAKNNPTVANSVPTLVSNYIASGRVPANLLVNGQVPDSLKTQLQHDFTNAMNQGLITTDANGNAVVQAGAVLPWNDPSTFMEYTDFNGKPIPVGQSGPLQGNVVGTNGQPITDASGKTITQAAMSDAWKSFVANNPPSVLAQFYSGTTFDSASFAAYMSLPSKPPVDTGATTAADPATQKTAFDKAFQNNKVLQNAFDSFESQNGTAMKALKVYDKEGQPIDQPDMSYLWQQLSQYANNGSPITDMATFQRLLNNNDLVIDKNTSTILNYTDPSLGANAGNNYAATSGLPNSFAQGWNTFFKGDGFTNKGADWINSMISSGTTFVMPGQDDSNSRWHVSNNTGGIKGKASFEITDENGNKAIIVMGTNWKGPQIIYPGETVDTAQQMSSAQLGGNMDVGNAGKGSKTPGFFLGL